MSSLTLKQDYENHRKRALRAGIEFTLSFGEWLAIWKASGKLAERGQRRGQYVMARYGDKGPYSIENVKIITCTENIKELWGREDFRAAHALRLRGNKRALGHKHSPETLEAIRAARKGQKPNLGNKGYTLSKETKLKMSEARKRYWQRRKDGATL